MELNEIKLRLQMVYESWQDTAKADAAKRPDLRWTNNFTLH